MNAATPAPVPAVVAPTPPDEAWLGAGLLLGAGIPMVVVGGQKVPNPAATRTALGPWLSPHSAGLALRLAL